MSSTRVLAGLAVVAVIAAVRPAAADPPRRARDWGIPFEGQAGPLNAITDVPGVEVGQLTIDSPPDRPSAHTGVTVIFPRGRAATDGVAAALFAFNGTGELTGSHLIQEVGGFFGPVALTGTLNVGVVGNALLRWTERTIQDPALRYTRILPVVGETYDGELSDAWRFPLVAADVDAAIADARGGAVAEGNVGGGTGMVCYDRKCGIGTASRVVALGDARYTVGVLVQANHGRGEALKLTGVPVGRLLVGETGARVRPRNSIIIVVATDAPLDATGLARVARRATVGLARTGGVGEAGSGDIFLAFSTTNNVPVGGTAPAVSRVLPITAMTPVFEATADATEEAIVNALFAGRTMAGWSGLTVPELDKARAVSLVRQARAPGRARVAPR